MAPVLASLVALVLDATTLSATSVPANGKQEVLLTLDAPTSFVLTAKSASGTRCEVVDRVRGVFTDSGSVGRTNCELDLSLDVGEYLIRLESPRNAKGTVSIAATAYAELNPTPKQLIEGSGTVQTLRPRQQATYWFTLPQRRAPMIHVVGRYAGQVQLWRSGQWLEPVSSSPRALKDGVQELWLDEPLEAGTYRLVIVGREPAMNVNSSGDPALSVELGFRRSTQDGFSFELPASGFVAVQTDAVFSMVSVALSSSTEVNVEAFSAPRSVDGRCRIDARSSGRQCGFTSGSTAPVISIRGAPGTKGLVRWERPPTGQTRVYDVLHGGAAFSFSTTGGSFIVGARELVEDVDAVPFGCQLRREQGELIAADGLALKTGEKLERSFNYDGSAAMVGFEIASKGSLLERVGIGGRRFRIKTSAGLKQTCEVYRLDKKGVPVHLNPGKTGNTGCDELLELEAGRYQVSLRDGLTGAETLLVQLDGDTKATASTQRGSCQLGPVTLEAGEYRLVTNGGSGLRALELIPLPLVPARGLQLRLDTGESMTFPIRVNEATELRSTNGKPFTCTRGKSAANESAVCQLTAGDDTLTLSNGGSEPVTLIFGSTLELPPLKPLVQERPASTPLPALSLSSPQWFDFEKEQTQLATFEVQESGLYQVSTEGLLATECKLRRPVDEVAEARGGGRGRNCLIQTYLQRGSYLFRAKTIGPSRGRGALSLRKQPAVEKAAVSADGSEYFRVDADTLVQQQLQVKREGTYALATTVQGNSPLSCRLEDAKGWPLSTVPSPCSSQLTLSPGTYRWTQLPLTVESMRKTSLTLQRPAITLKGNKPHEIEAFTWYSAELGDDGKDEFRFTLEGETELDVILTSGMQGRVLRLEPNKKPTPVEVIPPSEDPSEQSEEESEPSSYEESESEGEYSEGESEGESEEMETAPAAPPARAAPPPPSGTKITLPAGSYALITEHARADVGISYRLHFGSAVLLPGMTRDLPVPSTVPVLVPRSGTLRLSTRGDADVRCRLLDQTGRRVLEGSDDGDDWNCAIAELVPPGTYTLAIESETAQSGSTTLHVALPPVEERGALPASGNVTLGAAVTSYELSGTGVEKVSIRSTGKKKISCALEGDDRHVHFRQSRVGDCTFVARLSTAPYSLRVWTTDASTPVTVTRTALSATSSSSIEPMSVVRRSFERAGRYRSAPQVVCLPVDRFGVFEPCGPEVSLEKGEVDFAAIAGKSQKLDSSELLAATDKPFTATLSRRPLLQRVTADSSALMLAEVSLRHGEPVAPTCAFDGEGNVREREKEVCFAVARPTTSAVLRAFTPSEEPTEASLTTRTVALPSNVRPLAPGRQTERLAGVGRFALPASSRARVELTVGARSWVVQLDSSNNAIDLCAPHATLRRCVLTGQGGEVVVIGSGERVEIDTTLLEGAVPTIAFTGLYEDVTRVPGTVRLTIPPSDTARSSTVEGARSCTTILSTGERLERCGATIPPRVGAVLIIEHDVGPLRASVHTKGRDRWARLGLELPIVPGVALSPNVALPLQSGRLDRTLVVERESIVRISADSGVCGLLRANELLAVDGLDAGCELMRALQPGTYRVLVRPFAGRAQPGSMRWSAEPVAQLTEGVGAEAWVAAGEARVYRFETAAAGKVGLGLQASSEELECEVLDASFTSLGTGCHQYLTLKKGVFLLTVKNPAAPGVPPRSIRPVLLGLTGDRSEIPADYLERLFRNVD